MTDEEKETKRRKEIEDLKKQRILVSTSLQNAVNQLNDGKVVSAAVIEDLYLRKAAIEKALAKLEGREEDPPPAPLSMPEGENGVEEEEVGIPERLRIKRHYTLSADAVAQRKAAANSPKKSESMLGNRNAWKHGLFAQGYLESILRPCKSTCASYPCEIVEEGGTRPGGVCLDRAEVLRAYQAIADALKNKKLNDVNDLVSLTLARTFTVVNALQDDILRDGTMAKKEKYDKSGEYCGYEVVPHPSLLMLPKLLGELGIPLSELMITPKAIEKGKEDEKNIKTLADTMSELGRALRKGKRDDGE